METALVKSVFLIPNLPTMNYYTPVPDASPYYKMMLNKEKGAEELH